MRITAIDVPADRLHRVQADVFDRDLSDREFAKNLMGYMTEDMSKAIVKTLMKKLGPAIGKALREAFEAQADAETEEAPEKQHGR